MTEKVYRMLQFERGIGDLLMSLYGIYGFCIKHNFPKVQLFTHNHREWLELFDIPNFEYFIIDPNEQVTVDYVIGDRFEEALERWRINADVKEWYASKLGCKPLIPPLKQNLFQDPPSFQKPYIVLSPFASITTRTWEVHNWRILARKLKEAGYTCIALDGPNQAERCGPVEVQYFWGQSAEWVTKVCKNAELVISNDSGLAHVCSLIETKALVILSQMNPQAYYSMSDHHFVMPDKNIPCVECRVQPDRGYEEKCDFGCWALQSISPNQVFQSVMEILSQSKPI
jgi:Glycosyltransferase family 9 (heptosyltransferase)